MCRALLIGPSKPPRGDPGIPEQRRLFLCSCRKNDHCYRGIVPYVPKRCPDELRLTSMEMSGKKNPSLGKMRGETTAFGGGGVQAEPPKKSLDEKHHQKEQIAALAVGAN